MKYLRKKYCKVISTQHVTREYGSIEEKYIVPLLPSSLPKLIRLFSFKRSELENKGYIFEQARAFPCLFTIIEKNHNHCEENVH